MLNQVFISYRQESPEHSRSVRRLGELLRQAKIAVALDQFFVDDHAGGPDSGWPKWCEDCANQSQCVLIIGSEGWFGAYDKTAPPGVGLGAAAEADLFRQNLWDEKAANARIRLAFLNEISFDSVPARLRPWSTFHPFKKPEDLNQLIRWVGDCLGMQDIQLPTVRWPEPIAFQPDLADRNKKEWPAIVDLLAGRSRERILLFEGGTGVGKSELLRQAQAYAKQLGIPVAPVNLKGGSLSVVELLGLIDLELGAHLHNFSRDQKTPLLRKDLRALRQPVLFTLDTYEDVADSKAVPDFLNQQLFAEVESALGLCVIVAGKQVPDITRAAWRTIARRLLLEPIIELRLWEEWVDRRYPNFPEKHALGALVKAAGGSPVLMATFCARLAEAE